MSFPTQEILSILLRT